MWGGKKGEFRYWTRIKLARSKWLILARSSFCEVHKNAKKRTKPIFSHLDRTSSVNKGFIILIKRYFLWGTQMATLNWQVSPILSAEVANHSAGFGSSCPLVELAIVIYHSQLAQSHNTICFGGSLHKNNTSFLLLGLYHASVIRISIVLMQITPQDERYYGICASSKWESNTHRQSLLALTTKHVGS